MAISDPGFQLLHTKLHRPAVDADHIHRPPLLARLNRHRQRPLTLISAPAGYGKSTLASCWLDTGDVPGAWVSLDENDNDLRVFLAYFLAAIHSLLPGSLPQTETLLNAPVLPPGSVLAQSLINELDEIETTFILVLDDYHTIREKSVHDLLSQLLQYPPAPMHLVVSSRYEPPLSIASFRARRHMTEIRARDLRFTRREASVFLKQVMEVNISEETVSELVTKTEGWITGIHLAALSLRRLGEVDQCVSNLTGDNHQDAKDLHVSLLPGKNRYIMEYFIAEIFSNQSEHVKNMLIRTAILKQFNARLCEALCNASRHDKSPVMSGQEFIDWLTQSNLFLIALDSEGQWFRYHHLFKQSLERQLKREFSPDDIATLHKNASAWLDRHDYVIDAIDQRLASGDLRAAAQIIERHRHTALDNDNWVLLKSWIARLPEYHHHEQPESLITMAWLELFQGAFRAIPPILEKLDYLAQNKTIDQSLEGEIYFFKAVVLFWDGRIATSLKSFNLSLQKINQNHTGVRSLVEVYTATASQMIGQDKPLVQRYQSDIHRVAKDSLYHSRLIASLIFIDLLSGKLTTAQKWGQILLEMGIRTQNAYLTGWSEYFLAYIHYQRNDLEVAARHFSRVLENKYYLDLNIPIDSFAGLALALQAMGHPAEANEAIDRMLTFAQQSNSARLMALAGAARTELLLAQGDPGSAALRSKDVDLSTDKSPMLFWIVEPRITQCKGLLLRGSKANLHQAAERLDRLLQLARETHNIPQTIALLNLKAVACNKLNDIDQAVNLWEQALLLGQPGGWIRPFAAPGAEMRSLFDCLDRDKFPGDYVDTIMTALDTEKTDLAGKVSAPQTVAPSASSQLNLAAPLTNREIDILGLLKGRLSNQEIADKLFISPETVKRHLYNIYRKLSVKNRREASAKIATLNILP